MHHKQCQIYWWPKCTFYTMNQCNINFEQRSQSCCLALTAYYNHLGRPFEILIPGIHYRNCN